MRQDVTSHLPEEACGLVSGKDACSVSVFPVENILHSPVRFRMEPYAQLQAFEEIEEQGLELLAIYHSHPNGPPVPSPTDLTEFAYPGTITLIFSPVNGAWICRGFLLEGGNFREIPVYLIAGE
jgi:proteasome lid subunit RPN8/RPN11